MSRLKMGTLKMIKIMTLMRTKNMHKTPRKISFILIAFAVAISLSGMSIAEKKQSLSGEISKENMGLQKTLNVLNKTLAEKKKSLLSASIETSKLYQEALTRKDPKEAVDTLLKEREDFMLQIKKEVQDLHEQWKTLS